MKRKIIAQGVHISLGNLMKEDMPFLKIWRNQQMNILRQSRLLTDEDQIKFYKKVKSDKNQILFSVLDENEEIIGYCGIVHIDWENSRGEISFVLKTGLESKRSQYKKLFSETLRELTDYSFAVLKLHKIYTETFSFRKFHISILEECGFELEGRLRDQVFKKGRFTDSLIHSVINKK